MKKKISPLPSPLLSQATSLSSADRSGTSSRAPRKLRAVSFEQSTQLRSLFNHHLAAWKKRHRSSLEELAERCGVSASYLSHVGRYGRVPGRPILILLALNFELSDPRELFRVAGVDEPWPFDSSSRIAPLGGESSGFLSVKLDMDGLAQAIKTAVLADAKPRSIEDLTKGKALRIGLNEYQHSMFQSNLSDDATNNFFVDVCQMLALTLRTRVEFIRVPFAHYREQLQAGDIDLFGPKLVRPQTTPGLVSTPVCRIALSALIRKKSTPKLTQLPAPKSAADILKRPYQIAVLKDSRSHLYCNVVLHKKDSELILCDSLDEAIERALLTKIGRAAHLVILNGPTAVAEQREHEKDLDIAFETSKTALEFSENCFAIRPDWPELVPLVNQSIQYLQQNGAIAEKIASWFPPELQEVIQAPRN